MTSSTADGWWLRVRSGRDAVVVRPGLPGQASLSTEPGRPLVLEVGGVEPGAELTVRVGTDDVDFVVPAQGLLRWSPSLLLDAVAGSVPVRVTHPGGDELETSLDVRPSKMAEESLLALLQDLDDLSPGLAADLGGKGLVAPGRVAPNERLLQLLEQITGLVAEATAQVRAHPLHKVRERVTAFPSSRPRLTARDVRWLAQHPAAQLRATAAGRDVDVRRDRKMELDVPENRGVVQLLDHLSGLVDGLVALIREDRQRIEASRAVRENFRTSGGNLFKERDVPRLRSLSAREERVRTLAHELTQARRRTGLPGDLPGGPLLRSARVESHPGYWGLHRIGTLVTDVEAPPPAPMLQPLGNLDDLYETWCAIQMASALADWAGTSLGKVLRLEEAGWFVRLPRGEIVRVEKGGKEYRLHYEPQYHWKGRGDLVKLHPGRPWCPDLVIEVREQDRPVELHVFDAKHRIDPEKPNRLPMEALKEVWFKYPDSIGFRKSGLPAVSSVWILYPGDRAELRLNSPQMLRSDWPQQRVSGGAISAVPGADPDLQGLITRLLR